MAMGLGIDEAKESIYPAHFERNSELADTFDGRAQILDRGLALQAKWWRRVTGRCAPEHPDFVLEVGGELDGDALALHRKAETYARTHEMGYAEAYIRSPRVGSRSTRRVPREGRPHNRDRAAWPPASAIVADTARGPLSLDPNAHRRGAPARRPSAWSAADAA